jgi:ABC-2 type transport system permease protein
VERGGVLASKWLATVFYIFAGLALVAAVSYGAGIVAFGASAPELLSGGTVSVAQGLWLTLLAYLYVGVAMVCVASIAMLLSTITDSSLTAAIGTLVLVIALQIVGSLSYFDFLQPYLFTTYFETWQGLFQGSIDWAPLLKGLATFVAYSGVTMGASWYVFRRKDIAV